MSISINMIIIVLLLVILICIECYQNGDRISAMSMTVHDGWKTQYTDLSIHQMPRFRIKDSTIFHCALPHPDLDGPQMNINLEADVKMSLTFSNSKLIVPMVIVYDSNTKKSLIQLVITFYHDDFSVERISYDTKYGNRPLHDVSHPSLTSFEIVYKWEGEQEDDLAIGITTMFLVSLFAFIWITCAVMKEYDDTNEMLMKKQTKDRRSINISKSKGSGFSSTRKSN